MSQEKTQTIKWQVTYKGLGIHSINEETVSKERKPKYLLKLPHGEFLCMLIQQQNKLSFVFHL